MILFIFVFQNPDVDIYEQYFHGRVSASAIKMLVKKRAWSQAREQYGSQKTSTGR